MPIQKLFDGLLHQFKDIRQIVAIIQFFVEFVCVFIVQTFNPRKIQYVTEISLLNFVNEEPYSQREEMLCCCKLIGEKMF